MARIDGRANNEVRTVKIARNFTNSAPGSVLIQLGNTKLLCTATIQHAVPDFLKDTGRGWVTAEYSMLPGSTAQRKYRERGTRFDSRSIEIQRIIGRVLRSVIDLELLGERTIWIDCDVLEADGGTRGAAITGGYVALVDAIESLKKEGVDFPAEPIKDFVAGVSVGVVDNELLLDLCYQEDSRAQVDMNIAMMSTGKIVEIQGTAEASPFSRDTLNKLLELAREGINQLIKAQKEVLFDQRLT